MALAAAPLSPDPSCHGSSQEQGAGSGLALPTNASREPGTEPVPTASSSKMPWELCVPSQWPAKTGARGSSTLYPRALRPFPTRNSQSHVGNLSVINRSVNFKCKARLVNLFSLCIF